MSYEIYWDWYGRIAKTSFRTGVRVAVPPLLEPVTVAEAAMHSGIDAYGSPPEFPQENLIASMISAARDICERYLGRSLCPQVLQFSAHCFPDSDYIELPFGPVRGIESVVYNDGTGDVLMGTSEYVADIDIDPARIYTVYGTSWPAITPRPGGLKIRYASGYTIGTDSPNELPLPPSLRAAILLTFGHLYENRETTSAVKLEEIPQGAVYLMQPYKLRLGMA